MNAEQPSIQIERMRPRGAQHPLALETSLGAQTAMLRRAQQVQGLAAFLTAEHARTPEIPLTELRTASVIFGSGENQVIRPRRPHLETFVVGRNKEGEEGDMEIGFASIQEFQQVLRELGAPIQVLGVERWGNVNQTVESAVQGIDPEQPGSGYERPNNYEGSHMVISLHAFDDDGNIHIFRTLQGRNGVVRVDTPRGFAEREDLEDGTQMYDIEGAGVAVINNLEKLVDEEAGNALKIKKVTYLGAPVVNASFVTSQSALFGVEVDYNSFLKSQQVITPEEVARRVREFKHEGLIGGILDMTLEQYISYKTNPDVPRDLAADGPVDIMVIDHLAGELEAAQRREIATIQFLAAEFPDVLHALLAHQARQAEKDQIVPPAGQPN